MLRVVFGTLAIVRFCGSAIRGCTIVIRVFLHRICGWTGGWRNGGGVWRFMYTVGPQVDGRIRRLTSIVGTSPFGAAVLEPCFDLWQVIKYDTFRYSTLNFQGLWVCYLPVAKLQLNSQMPAVLGRKVLVVGKSSLQALGLLRGESHLSTFALGTTRRKQIAVVWRVEWEYSRRCWKKKERKYA